MPLADPVDTTATIVASGVFQNGPYGTVSGKGQVLKSSNGSYTILLDSFSTINGPDLYVYISKQAMPVDFIEVGKLKSTNGRQVYDLSGMADVSQFNTSAFIAKATIICLGLQSCRSVM